MPDSNIETLKKLEFENIDQLLEDLNRNFAVLTNSPLYKGIPGNPGGPGGAGLRGARGSSFIFINFSLFQSTFPGELATASNISITYLNSKLAVFESKQLLLTALSVTELVDKDILVLTNSIMLSYAFTDDKFIDTGIAFNEQTNLANSIEQKIEDYVAFYIANNSGIGNLKNIFSDFSTLGKNYADTNNSFVSNSLTNSSVYSPYIPGYNSEIGTPVNDHKYIGLTDAIAPKTQRNTMVFGSIKRYYDLLMKTISTDGSQTLSSDYAPGVNNIPAAIFLQDTYNNGLLFGYKDKQNLKNFGSIYKNEIDELVLKSDSGSLDSEFSALLLHKDYLKYSKKILLGNDLEISRDLTAFGDLNTKGVRTGKFTSGANNTNNYNNTTTEIGIADGILVNVADIVEFKKYVDVVMVTDPTGIALKTYKIEKTNLNEADIAGLNTITGIPNSAFNIPTSAYFSFLARKVNAVTDYVNTNYWKKNQFGTGDIPDLKVSNTLTAVGNSSLSGVITANKNARTLLIDSLNTQDNSQNITYGFFQNNVLVTDSDGNLSKSYFLDQQILDPSEIAGNPIAIYSESKNTLISTYHYAHLGKKINAIAVGAANDSWNKAQFNNFDIPSLALNNDLRVRGNVAFGPDGGVSVFSVDRASKNVGVGDASAGITLLKSSQIMITQFAGKVIVTDGNGNILNTYIIETANFNNAEQAADNVISNTLSSGTNIPTSAHVGWLATKINNVVSWVKNNFWTRTQLSDGSVNTLRAANVQADSSILVGSGANPLIQAATNTNTVIAGTSNGTLNLRGSVINFDGRAGVVITTNGSGTVQTTYAIETTKPTYVTPAAIEANFWGKTSVFSGIANSINNVVTSDMFKFIMDNFDVVRKMLYDRPTFADLNNGNPFGLISMWTNTYGGFTGYFYSL